MKNLVPCANCARHVRAFESTCPFCGAAASGESAERVVPSAKMRLGRAALFAFGATLAATTAACGSMTMPTDSGTNTDSQVADAAVDNDAGEGGPQTRYGAPPPALEA